MVKVLSWDVGVINLAYCLMTKTKNGFKIYDWKRINLIEQDIHKCIIKDCTKDAIWSCGNKYYCGRHKNQKKILYPAKKHDIKNCECNHTFKQHDKSCTSSIHWSLNDGKYINHYCNRHKPKGYDVLKSIKKLKTNKCQTNDLQKKLLEKLDQMTHLLDADVVVIENQPSYGHSKVKVIASTLYDFYLMRSTIDKDIIDNNIEKVQYMSSSNKLKLNEDNKTILAKKTRAKRHQINKKLAIIDCKKMLKDDEYYLDYLDNQKKKDDLCDCFLQGCYYLTNRV